MRRRYSEEAYSDHEESEFEQLVEEMKPHEFTESRDVSRYITKHKLGHKYRHISGIIEMEQDGDTWNFNGGFPPRIYAKLCQRLGLSSRGSRARVNKFTPYKDL